MASLEAIARMTFEGRTEGLDKVSAELNAVSRAQERVAETGAVTAKASETSARGQLSLAGAFERLQRQIDPTFRMQQELARGQSLLDRAFEQGVIDTQAYGRSLDLLKSKYGTVAAANSNFAKATESSSFQVSNLAAQFQDIAVQLQGGTSPLTVALQQGTQISSVLGPMGAAGAVKSLGSAFLSLISPVSLVTVGAIALGGAAVQYLMSMGKGVEDLDTKLKRHDELIRALKDAYGEAGKGVDEYGKRSRDVLEQQIKASIRELEQTLKDESKKFAANITITTTPFVDIASGVGPGDLLTQAQAKYAAFNDVLLKLRVQATAGTPQIKEFEQGIADIMRAAGDNENIRKAGVELLNLANQLGETERKLQASKVQMTEFGDAAISGAVHVKAFGEALSAIQGLALPDLTDSEKLLQNYRKGLDSSPTPSTRNVLRNEFLDAQIRINIRDTKKAVEELTQAEQNAALQGMKPLERATEEANIKFRERTKEIERLKQNGADSAAVAQLEAGAQKVLAQELRNAAAAESERGAKSRDAFDDALTTAHARTQQLEEETRLIGQNGAELEANKLRIELEAQAKKKSIEINDQVRASIEAEVEARRKAVADRSFGMAMSDLTFERDQIGRDPVEQQVFSRLRSAGIEFNSVQGQIIADQIRLNETLRETHSLGSEALKGFVSDLRNGASVADAFRNALHRIEDKLMDMALNQISSGLFGAKGGGGLFGSLLSGAQSLFQPLGPALANGGVMTEHGLAPLNRYATGGVANSPQVALFGEGRMPEAYVPLPDGRSIPVTMKDMAAPANGNAVVYNNIEIVTPPGTEAKKEERRNSSGGVDLKLVVQQIAAEGVATPGSQLNRAVRTMGRGVPLTRRG